MSLYSLMGRSLPKITAGRKIPCINQALLTGSAWSQSAPSRTYVMFEQEEAVTFLEQKLGIKDVRVRKDTDRRRLLDDVTTGLQLSQPFTNIHAMSWDVSERRRPTLAEVKMAAVSVRGGVCYNFNTTTHFLLKALGYDVSFVLACLIDPVPNHLINFVRDVEKPGDLFLMDSGCAYPTFRAVSLDFDEESPVFKDSFLEYKFVRQSDGRYARLHGAGDSKNRDCVSMDDSVYMDKWRRAFVIDPSTITKDLEDFNDIFDDAYRNPDVTPFYQTFRSLGYVNRRAVIVSNDKLIMENESGILEEFPISGGDEGVIETVLRYFPNIPEHTVRRARTNFRSLKTRSRVWVEE